jgi:hypothetical protein
MLDSSLKKTVNSKMKLPVIMILLISSGLLTQGIYVWILFLIKGLCTNCISKKKDALIRTPFLFVNCKIITSL